MAILVLVLNIIIYKLVKDRFNRQTGALLAANEIIITYDNVQIVTGLLLSILGVATLRTGITYFIFDAVV